MKAAILRHAPWLLPILAMVILTPFTPTLDLKISHHFYDKLSHFQDNAFYSFIYYFASIPAILTTLIACLMLVRSNSPQRKALRKPALILILTMLLGSGLITNLILKDHWGRPRPKQIVEFGGTQQFRPYYEPNFFHQTEKSKSFPSGHVTMGFYFFALVLIAKRQHAHKLFWVSLSFTCILGFILALTRIAQGGHFFSDTVMSALIMWLVAYGSDKWVYRHQAKVL